MVRQVSQGAGSDDDVLLREKQKVGLLLDYLAGEKGLSFCPWQLGLQAPAAPGLQGGPGSDGKPFLGSSLEAGSPPGGGVSGDKLWEAQDFDVHVSLGQGPWSHAFQPPCGACSLPWRSLEASLDSPFRVSRCSWMSPGGETALLGHFENHCPEPGLNLSGTRQKAL